MWLGYDRLLRAACAGGLALGVITVVLADDDFAEIPHEAVAPTRSEPLINRHGVLLLRNGRMVSGKISQNASGFLLTKPNGTMLIPVEQVRFSAESRSDVYRRLHREIPAPLAKYHVALARWCITNNMYDKAETELRAALKTDPNHQEARQTLLRLDEVFNRDRPLHESAPESPRQTHDGFQLPETHSLAGLSPNSAREFATRVHPILLNKCGNASCHGPRAKNDFRLTRFGGRRNRLLAERNLASVLKFVDADEPANSPLLTKAAENHGQGGQSVFQGTQAGGQRQALIGWVHAVAREIEPTAATVDFEDDVDDNGSEFAEPLSSNHSSTARRLTDDPTFRHVLQEERPDLFDPEEFNNQSDR